MPHTTQHYLLPALVLCSFLFLPTCGSHSGSSPEASTTTAPSEPILIPVSLQEQQRMGLKFTEVDSAAVPLFIKADGVLELPPSENFDITAPLGGLVELVYVRPGSTVTKGQPLARIQNPDFIELQKDFLSEKAGLIAAEQDYLRQKELLQSQAASLKAFQEAESRYLSQKALVKALDEKLRLLGLNPEQVNESILSRFTTLVAPTTGSIAAVFVRQGQYVNATQPVCQLANLQAMELKLMIYQNDWPKVKKGLSVSASLPSESEKAVVYRGIIDRLGVQAGTEKFLPAYCTPVLFDAQILRPGLMLNALIPYDQAEGWRLPAGGLVRTGEIALTFYQKAPDTLGVEEVTPVEFSDTAAVVSFRKNFEPRGKKFVVSGAYTLFSYWKNSGP